MKKIACIVAAGKGTRSFHYPYLHKALLPLGNKATLSHCLDQLSNKGIEKFVIALQKGEEVQIKSFLNNIHHDKIINYVICDARGGKYIGPGRTLELCKEFLNNPFIALGCDTLGDFDLKKGDWITTSKDIPWKFKDKLGEYAYFDENTKNIKRDLSTADIVHKKNCHFFSGVIGVENFKSFWEISATWNDPNKEKPIYAGFQDGMYDKVAMNLWLDTGGEKSYKYARSLYKEIVEPKSEQEIFIYREKVIKFFKSEITCNMLINRHNLLRPYSPVIVRIDKNLISYQFIKGKLLSETKET